MVKCVVSGCPNRVVNVKRGIFNRAPKRFFNFPKDPARVKVWLAALRETDVQDSTEEHLICEDHFLPEDISKKGVNSDAIPLMPPSLDMTTSWGAELSEEEEEEEEANEEEEVQWTTGGEVEDEEDAGGRDDLASVDPPAPEPGSSEPSVMTQDPDANTSVVMTTSDSRHVTAETLQAKKVNRQDVSLGLLTRRFLDLFLTSPDGTLDLREATTNLQTCKRRVYDITNVLDGIKLIKKESANRIKWIGRTPISSFLWNNQDRNSGGQESLRLVEDTLDTLIKSCAQQLFDMTDDAENSALAYVTHRDISRLGAFQEQTVIVVKAPEETKLEVPAPTEDNIQVHLKGGKGPIVVMTCDVGSLDVVSGEKSGCFVELEGSRMKTSTLHAGKNAAE